MQVKNKNLEIKEDGACHDNGDDDNDLEITGAKGFAHFAMTLCPPRNDPLLLLMVMVIIMIMMTIQIWGYGDTTTHENMSNIVITFHGFQTRAGGKSPSRIKMLTIFALHKLFPPLQIIVSLAQYFFGPHFPRRKCDIINDHEMK